jgi:uncharacterized protein YfkK (UPF0435 family)
MKSPTLKNPNLEQLSLEELHQESRNWLSTIAFWKDEVRFMHNLINKNFVYFISKDQKGSLDALLNKVTEIEKEKLNALKTSVINHEKHLSDSLKNLTDLNINNFLDEHRKISKDFVSFKVNYRLFKGELFRLAEEVLKEKDIKKLVS